MAACRLDAGSIASGPGGFPCVDAVPVKAFVLYSHMAPYMAACLRAAGERGVELAGTAFRGDPGAPFHGLLRGLGEWTERDGETEAGIRDRIRRFDPDVLLVSGWMDRAYLSVARWARARGCPVVGLADTQWRGTPKQHLARLGRRFLQQRWFDALWVPGERQAEYARRLGFGADRVWQGAYACDWPRFRAARRGYRDRSRRFLYVGRFVEAKGIATLAEAYARYRTAVADPWELHCIGAGPLRAAVEGRPGVRLEGFVQPERLPETMAGAAAFVLPSLYEPWGVALHEAATLGHPLIATDACGAADHLLRDGRNGYRVPAGSAQALADALIRLHRAAPEQRARMGEESSLLSERYTPEQWARTLVEVVGRLAAPEVSSIGQDGDSRMHVEKGMTI